MNPRLRQLTMRAGAAALVMGSLSCGKVVREGRSPVLLVMDSLSGAAGQSGVFAIPLLSDVLTNGGIFDDAGKATLHILLKDQGPTGAGTSPSSVNTVILNRYHVDFVRSDGRNVQGVDVPYSFDGGVTAMISSAPSDVPFELVRHQAKEESPLINMAGGGGRIFISTIANVTFYGKDIVGNDVQVTGAISVNFADFADPKS
jgi:hypothetical protein